MQSAKSFKKFIPHINVYLYTDDNNFRNQIFDKIFYIKFEIPQKIIESKIYIGTKDPLVRNRANGQFFKKMEILLNTPFNKTLYLGTDTLSIHEDVNTLFILIEKFDIAMAHAPC